MKMPDIHVYLRYTNSYVLFSDWRTIVRLHTVNSILYSEYQVFHSMDFYLGFEINNRIGKNVQGLI